MKGFIGKAKNIINYANIKVLLYIIQKVLLALGGLFFYIGYTNTDFNKMFEATFCCLCAGVLYGLFNLEKRIAYVLFLASFFCFMLGRLSVDYFCYGEIRFYFSQDISIHMMSVIFISLVILQIAYEFFDYLFSRQKKEDNNLEYIIDDLYYINVRKIAKVSFYISAVCAVLCNMEQFVYIRSSDYLSLYTNFTSQLPRIIRVIGNMYITFYAVYLATCPKKKKCILTITIFLFITFSILLTGDRGTFIINIAITLVYIFWRQYRDKKIWIPTKVIIISIISAPLVIAFMSYFVYLREGVDVGEKDIFNQFLRFFKSSGNSVDILGYGKQYENKLPQSMYSFGEFIDYIKYNPITQKLFKFDNVSQYTKEYAMNMHSYAHVISYYISGEKYLLGHGKGSAYIAEVYHDFGYLGLIVFNAFYAMLLAGINKVANFGPIKLAVVFISIRIMFYIPRGAAILPISYVLNITTVFALIFVWCTAKYGNRIMQMFGRRTRSR